VKNNMAKRKSSAAGAGQASQAAAAAAPEYTVLARRYRPRQFADVIGQEPVTRALVNALESNRVAHAYLFTGARGVGKTSTARILAKALNCAKGPTATPCDECDTCLSIASGEDVDVLEIDGASNNGVEQVRELRQNVQFRPARSRYKIYIIDEVHMLSIAAFNALLKTLEEPPPHVKFIFATTELKKIPVTILSRCQRFDFAGIGTARIVEHLRQVMAGEGRQADDQALEVIARRAGGSMRDAQSLLDQLLAFSGDGEEQRLTAESVFGLLGMANDDRVAELATTVLEGDSRKVLDLLGQQMEEGLQLGELLDQLIEYWRDLMVVNCAGSQACVVSVPPRHRDQLKRQAASLSLDSILSGLDILTATKSRLRASGHGRVLLEMALIRLGRLGDLVSLTQLSQWLGGADAATTERGTKQAGSIQSRANAPKQDQVPASTAAAVSPKPAERGETEKKNQGGPRDERARTQLMELNDETAEQVWSEVLARADGFLANDLEKVEGVAISGPNTLVLRFPTQYNRQCEQCQEPVRKSRIEEALRKLTGHAWGVRAELVSNVAAATSTTAVEAETSQSRYRRQRAEAMKVPLVKRAFEVLGAQFVQVDEGFGVAPVESAERNESAEEL
jgi:DNA polymerase-3 subunit gamma/tau